ncbi:MAG: CoA transferase [Candidatus Melainabacteria bacterium]|nr:CoA transferase [Candidatus Melainabacteria bacterium]
MPITLLNGIKVLDLSRLLPGPMCTLHLADMGAEVIKIEEPKKGDYSRFIPPIQKINSNFFLALNRNKYSMTLDLTKEEGKNIFLKLLKTTDVVIESFRPGVTKKLGIDYSVVKKENPKVVYCSITGYGQTGPYRDKAGHDLNYCSYLGIIREPSIPGFQIADIVGGALNATMGILAALVYKKTTGQGQYLDVSMMDGTLAHQATELSSLRSLNEKDENISNTDLLTGKVPCYNIYKTADERFLAIAAIELKFWRIFCETINRKDLIPHHMVTGDKAAKVKDELTKIFKTKTLNEWIEYFKNVDCCVSPVLTFKEAVINEQIKARNMFLTEEHPIEGKVTQFGFPIKFSDFNFDIEKHAPMLGEDTEKMLKGLGYSDDEIKNLKLEGVI